MKVIESGMTFKYNDDDFYVIEKSPAYVKNQDGIKMADFLILKRDTENKPNELTIIEAKSTAPKINDSFIEDIHQKFSNCIALFASIRLGRHLDSDIRTSFKELDIKGIDLKFLLIIKDHRKEWLQQLTEKLRRSLKRERSVWNIQTNHVLVINEELAVKRKYVFKSEEQASTSKD